jgi:hypothetical protein
MSDPLQPNCALNPAPVTLAATSVTPQSPSNAAPVLAQAAQASGSATPSATPAGTPWLAGNGPVVILLAIGIPALIGISFLLALGIRRVSGNVSKAAAQVAQEARASAASDGASAGHPVYSAAQSEAEALFGRAAAGDTDAAQQVLSEASSWAGRTQRTPRANQFVTACLNSRDLNVRDAAIAALLAFDGVPANPVGLDMAEQAVGKPSQRLWGLWTVGALANRGVDPIRAAKVISAYVTDPDVRTRAAAVDGLSLVATDETVPMLLDRFRNDPSPIVQERAACDLSEAGMYTHVQRMVAARRLVGWVGDASLSAQQRGWATQALIDIAGKSFGANPSAWQSWYDQQSSSD